MPWSTDMELFSLMKQELFPAGKDFGLMFEALDSLKAGEVYIAAGASPKYALWGGLMTARAKYLKAAGAILNGYSRDTQEILSMNFPVFSYGSYAQDQKSTGKGTGLSCIN